MSAETEANLTMDSDQAKARAEAIFKRKEEQAREGANAMSEYRAASVAIAEKTTRLRALRLAKAEAERAKEQGRSVE